MARKHYENEVVRLADLSVTSDMVEGVTFQDCLVLGPAVVVPLGETRIENCSFAGTPDAIFWEVSEGRDLIIGAVGLSECKFDGCRFERVGFAGGRDILEALRGAGDANA